MPTYAKAVVGALIGALSFLAGAVTVDAGWGDLGRPSVVIGALLAALISFGGVYGVRNGVDPSPDTSTPEVP